MIAKSIEINKLELNNHNFYLFYGNNEGLKEEIIKNLFEKNIQIKFIDMKKEKYSIIKVAFSFLYLQNHFLIMKS